MHIDVDEDVDGDGDGDADGDVGDVSLEFGGCTCCCSALNALS